MVDMILNNRVVRYVVAAVAAVMAFIAYRAYLISEGAERERKRMEERTREEVDRIRDKRDEADAKTDADQRDRGNVFDRLRDRRSGDD